MTSSRDVTGALALSPRSGYSIAIVSTNGRILQVDPRRAICTALRLPDRTYSYSEPDVLFVAAERLHDVSVYVSHDNPMHLNPGPPELCAHIEGPISSGETRNVVCTQSFTGRYIIISMAGIDTLTLCEVEVDGVRGKAIMGDKSG